MASSMTTSLSNKHSHKPLRLMIETGEGRSASAILENDFLRHCLELGAEVHVLTPGACYEPFIERYRLPGVSFSYLSVQEAQKKRFNRLCALEYRFHKLFSQYGYKRAGHWLWKLFGARANAVDAVFLSNLLERVQPDCFITTDLNAGFGHGLVGMCCLKGIPTLGNVFSWDHPFYPLHSRPDRLTCWSPVIRDNLVNISGFLPEQIEITGAPIFDPYVDPAGVWTRQQLCDRMGLDPARPILLYATLGQMRMFCWDETGTFGAFLKALDQAALPGPPQIVLRLHPISIDHYFDEFRGRKDVVFSRYSRYCPGMRWWPSREEAFLAGNLLRHADVCISPGSTMTVEAAIFDTPTIVPVFNPIMSEEYDQFFQQNWLKKHFRFLVEEKTIGLASSPDELIAAVRRALADRTWLAEGRRTIREKLIGPLDGRATERLARAAVECAAQNPARKKNRLVR
jgi:hypothetical protein